MIYNASASPLPSSGGSLPDMQNALLDWFQTITFTKIVKSIVNFQLVEVQTSVTFQGIRQPFTAQQLAIKPEGQRAWRWEMIHAYPNLVLKPDDRMIFNGIKYRVMQKHDFSEYGYVDYEICQDYAP